MQINTKIVSPFRRTNTVLHEHIGAEGFRLVLLHRRLQRAQRVHRGSGPAQHQQ